MLTFSDGMQFDTGGALRLQYRRDGWYVVGEGKLIPVDSAAEGQELIRELTSKRRDADIERLKAEIARPKPE